MGERLRLVDWAQVVSAAVGAVAAFAAAYFGGQSISQAAKQQEDGKVVQTLTFFATFNGPSMLGIREKLSNGSEDWCGRYEHTLGYTQSVTRAEAASFIDFFDSVHLCSEREACDENFAQQLFGPYAHDHYDELAQTIVDNRVERGEGFGTGLQLLSGFAETPEEMAGGYAEKKCRVAGDAAEPTGQ